MDRKKTILIAVLVNAGLLCVLLITALTVQEEVIPSAPLLGQATPALPKMEERPLFTEMATAQAPQEIPLPVIPAQTETVVKEEPIVHSLPPVTAAPEAPVAVAPAAPVREVAVKKGDSLEKIAKANHTTVDEIMKLNHLSSNLLRVGQVLKLPSEKAVAATPQAKPVGVDYYTVKVGDNPWTIAMKHHMKVEELLRLNGLSQEKARKLKPGDRLRVR